MALTQIILIGIKKVRIKKENESSKEKRVFSKIKGFLKHTKTESVLMESILGRIS